MEVRDLEQHRAQPVVGPVAEIDRDGIEHDTQHARCGEQLDAPGFEIDTVLLQPAADPVAQRAMTAPMVRRVLADRRKTVKGEAGNAPVIAAGAIDIRQQRYHAVAQAVAARMVPHMPDIADVEGGGKGSHSAATARAG